MPLLKTCDKYIFCYYGQLLVNKCDGKQQFNMKTGKCDLARNVDCVENLCSIYATEKKDIYLPSAANCSNYYICQAGQVKHQNCEEGFYFSKACNCCDKMENVQCSIDDFSAPMENFKKNRSVEFSKSKPTLVGETNKVKCPPKGHFLYQYIEDSAYYFTCVEGKATLRACPNEFQFDDRLKRCSPNEKMVMNEKIICPMNGNTRIPHPQRNRYYLCIEGSAAVVACAPGLFYDDGVKSCTTESQGEIYSPLTNTHANMFICPKFGTFIFPHTQKNRYYICSDGNALGFACAPGQIFDIVTNTCENEEYHTVNSDDQKPQVLDEPVDILCPSFGAMKFAHKQKHKFYLCVNGVGAVLACAQGSFFEPQEGVCRRTFDLMKAAITTSEFFTIDPEPSIECPRVGTFVYPHTEENLYYVCLDGNPIVLTCPTGLIFDDTTKICSIATFENEHENAENFVDDAIDDQ